MKKLAIITTHPIQYNAPWFKLLAERDVIDLKVFYTWSQSQEKVIDRNFNQEITWDIPLLEGYDYEFVENIASKPGSHHFLGINNPELIGKVEKYQPDYLLVFGWNFISNLRLMHHFKGKIPIIFRGDSTLLDDQPGLKTLLRRTILKFVYRYVDKALYVGDANKAYFLAHGFKREDLIYAPHAIDIDRFMDAEKIQDFDSQALKLREKLNLTGKKVIVFAGKFEEKKQPKQLLKAVTDMNKDRSEKVHVLFVGSGFQENELKEMAKEKSFISFLPFQNQQMMPVIYRLADIFCLPSKGPGETWGMAVNESLASYTPVVVTNKVGCSQDLIKEGKNGYVVESGDLHSLKTGLEKALKIDKKDIFESCNSINSRWNFNTIVEALENEVNSSVNDLNYAHK